ncbi:unnamed protein product [Spodoptera exigua]|nr:unnamed protein product [Spodoptera exigua]
MFIFCHDIKSGKFAEASKNGTMVIVSLTITLKYVVLLHHQESIKELINIMERDYATAQEFCNEDKEIVVQYAKRGVTDLRDKRINVEFISFFVGCILHFFMPCYYSDLLMEKSEKFRQAIYSCGWEKCPNRRIRQIVLFMITRARIPLGITTVFYEINLDTFAEMCRQSYGILNLMNAAWE